MIKLNMRVIKWVWTLLFEILTIEVCFSNGNQGGSYDCIVRRGELCYFVGSNELQNWNGARQMCQSRNSTLPIIRNKEEQAAFVAYFGSLGRSFVLLWTFGKRKTYNDWTWINGQTLNTATPISPDSVEKAHIMLEWSQSRYIMKPENPVNDSWYLCQNKDLECNGQHNFNATYGCLVPSENIAGWHEARRDCLSKGGDLAMLTDHDLQILKGRRFQNPYYWIGLRKAYFVWDTGSQEEITYTNWIRQSTLYSLYGGDLCVGVYALNGSIGKWTASDCSWSVPTVCERRGETKPSTTLSSTIRGAGRRTTAATPFSIIEDDISSTVDAITITEQGDISSTVDEGKLALVVGLCIGIPTVAVIVIIAIYILANRKRKLRETSTSKDKKVAESQYQEFHRSDTQANANGTYTPLTSGPENTYAAVSDETTGQHYEEIP